LRNWLIGRYISEFELHGADRAIYGERLLEVLSTELRKVHISSCGARQLYSYLTFYRTYPKILRSLSAEFRNLPQGERYMKPLLAHKDHPLVSHLGEVANLSAEFAAAFDASEQGRLAGFLHDLGKAEVEFQERIALGDKDPGKKKPHAHHGAAYALRVCFPAQWPVALSVNGHHAGGERGRPCRIVTV
jgi:hypothetical protein